MPIFESSMGLYYLVMILTAAIGGAAQLYVSSQLKKYSNVASTYNMTGAEMARKMTLDKSIQEVGIRQGGANQDFFDPRTNSVTLDPEAFNTNSVTALATAVHEVGHATQYADGYAFMKFRSALVPVVNLASQGWMIVFILGAAMGMSPAGSLLMKIGIVMFAAVLLFHVVTLPVEFDASRRGLAYLKSIGTPQGELQGATRVLRACAFTDVAAARTALLQLLYLLASRSSNR
ncbi:MAG: zinc metallopeptidase [Eggerthellaceae bacterium]|nr:zinc metallopeptidase [Eggerthellaceae bacterium]